MNKMYKMMNNRKGFTLIELIVVIAILGILAAIAVPKLGGFRDKAATSADIATARTILSAAAIAQAQNGDSFTVGQVNENLDNITITLSNAAPDTADEKDGWHLNRTSPMTVYKDNTAITVPKK